MSEWGWLIALATLLVTVGINLIATGRWVGSVKGYVDQEVAAERLARATAMTAAATEHSKLLATTARDWADTQKSQDSAFGEVALSLRRAVENAEKTMHQIEIWGRDNYVQKPEFESLRADIKGLRGDIHGLISEIKQDFKESVRELKAEFAARG